MTEELNYAAKKYIEEIPFDDEDSIVYNAFKAGAKWCAKYIAEGIKIMTINNPKL